MDRRAKWGAAGSVPVARCAVTGCDAPAFATLRVDPGAPRAWLVDIADGDAGAWICVRHADALARSEGWAVHDARRRFARPDLTVAAPRRPLSALAATALAQHSVDLRRPRRRLTDDLLDARSPLLRRAFAKSRH